MCDCVFRERIRVAAEGMPALQAAVAAAEAELRELKVSEQELVRTVGVGGEDRG